MTSLLDLWALRVQNGNVRPSEADKDLDVASLDVIMAVVFDVLRATLLWPGESHIGILAVQATAAATSKNLSRSQGPNWTRSGRLASGSLRASLFRLEQECLD